MTFTKPYKRNFDGHRVKSEHEQKQSAKNTLLASAAKQNYQRCYRALKEQEKYWAGVKYILTVLDQKAKGVVDPLLYTKEEMESALEAPMTEPSFTSPGWRRKLSLGNYLTAQNGEVDAAMVSAAMRKRSRTPIPGSPLNPGQAIGWSLTGTMNSPSTNVAVMYTSESHREADIPRSIVAPPSNTENRTAWQGLINPATTFGPSIPTAHFPTPFTSTTSQSTYVTTSLPPPGTEDAIRLSDADLLLNFHSPFSASSPATTTLNNPPPPPPPPPSSSRNHPPGTTLVPSAFSAPAAAAEQPFGDMVIDSQDVDMSMLGTDMLPWGLDYLPHDLLLFGEGGFVDVPPPRSEDADATAGAGEGR